MQTVNSCCCGCSLKTGTLIILILSMIDALLKIFESFNAPGGPTESILISFVFLCISIAGIYGATQEKPVFLIPYMMVLLLGLVGLIIIMLASLIFGMDFIAHFIEEPADENEIEQRKKNGSSIILTVEIFCGIFAALNYYFFIVVLSFFKKLRSGPQENRNEATYTT